MSVIYKPQKDMELFAPFGPTMGYFKMPTDLVEKLNNRMSDKLQDYSNNLVGKVKEELKFDEETIKIAQAGVGQFIGKYQAYSEYRNSMGAKTLDPENFNYAVQIVSGWFVRQFEQEYNPLHILGDFYVFPSQLFHCVYPFYTKGERRSFSMNMNFIEVPKEKSVDK